MNDTAAAVPPTSPTPWAEDVADVLRAQAVSIEHGLSTPEVVERRLRFGANQLRAARRVSAWRILLGQFASLMVGLLSAAAVLAFVLVDWVEGTAIAAVIAINAAIGFFTELKARRSMEALYRLGQVTAQVVRDGRAQVIPAADLVPGDIVLLEGGDVVTADLRLIEASKLQANESTLTGESVPVEKSIAAVRAEAPLAERTGMLFKGTAVTRGSGRAIVVATGLATELGQITALVEETDDTETPIERRMERLGRRLILVTLVLAAAVGLAGIASGRETVLMIETAIALAVATVPEGLPVVATIALARGMWRMARLNALINRLSAVETLGATGVICTDKTGTLTENRMTVARILLPAGDVEVGAADADHAFRLDGAHLDPEQHAELRQALTIGVLCNNATLATHATHASHASHATHVGDDARAIGDPMETALLAAGHKAGITRQALLEDRPEAAECAFDPDIKMMATLHATADGYYVAVKGAPEHVLERSGRIFTASGERPFDSGDRQHWQTRNADLAAQGLRVLALAFRHASTIEHDPYHDLVFAGLLGLEDPPRRDVAEALRRCRAAGVRVVMVTGDQAVTARHVAEAVELVEQAKVETLPGSVLLPLEQLAQPERERLRQARVFARVSPREKLNLIALHQHFGEIVAMTGDGVNDAPALKKADIGVAMGQRGTQVARESADMVLRDDAFSTIVVAIEQGRIIFDNIRKFVLYLLSCNVSEVLVVGIAMLLNAPLPILPLQILFLNLVTDVFPALALGVGPGDPAVMQRRPRPSTEPILDRRRWLGIAGFGALITAATLAAFWLALDWLALPVEEAVTISFLTLALAQLWHVFNMRESGTSAANNEIVRNPWVWAALLVCIGLLFAALYVPVLAGVLSVVPPARDGWAVILALSLLPLAAGQMLRRYTRSTAGRVSDSHASTP